MLPKKKRVTKEVFQDLIREGKTFSTELFLFHFIKTKTPQYAFVAPKKIFKNAVERNKYRRIGYNIIRLIPLNEGKGIFIYKNKAKIATKKEIKESIIFLLKKNSLI